MSGTLDNARRLLAEWLETTALLRAHGCLPDAAQEAAGLLLADHLNVEEVTQ